MAVSLGTIEAILRLKDELTPALKRVGASLAEVGSEVRRAGTEMRELGSAMTIGVTAPLVAAAAGSLKFAADFETAMTKVGSITNIGTEGVEEMRKKVLELAPTVGIGPTALAEGLLVVASTGLTGARAVDVLTQAAKASAIGLGETTDVARAVTSAIKAYGAENLSAEEVTRKLFVAVKEGGAEANEFAGTLGRVVGIASQVGVSFDEVLASIATFTKLGVDAAEAVTGLRATMTAILAPSQDARDQLVELGTSIDELRASVREKGLAAAMIDLVKLTKGNDDAISAIIPNVRALAAVMGTAGAQGDEYVESLKRIKNASGEFDEAFIQVSKTMRFSWNQALAEGQALAIEFGEALAPAFRDTIPVIRSFIETLSEVVNWFTSLPQGIQTATFAFLALAAAMGPLTYLFGNMLSIGGGLAKAIGAITLALIGQEAATKTLAVTTTAMNAEVLAAQAFFGTTTAAMGTATIAADGLAISIGGIATAFVLIAGPVLAAIWGLNELRKLGGDEAMKMKWAETGAFAVGEFGAVVVDTSNQIRTGLGGAVREISGTAEQVFAIISGMDLDRRVNDLSVAFNRLTDSGPPTQKQFIEIAKQAKLLKDQGADVGHVFEHLISVYGDATVATGKAAGGTKVLTEEQKALALAVEAMNSSARNAQGMDDFNRRAADMAMMAEEVESAIAGALIPIPKFNDSVYTSVDAAGQHAKAMAEQEANLRRLGMSLNFAAISSNNASKEVVIARDHMEKWRKTVGELADSFHKLANIAGGKFGGIAREIGTIFASLDIAGTSLDSFKVGMDEISNGKAIEGLANVASGVMGIAGAFMQATEVGGTLAKTLKGALVGAQVGAQFGGAFGAAVGAAIGGAAGFFRSIFGGPGKAELEGRKLAEDFVSGLEAGISASQRAEAAASATMRWSGGVVAVRDAYIAVGRAESEALAIMEKLAAATRKGPDEVKKVIEEINGVLAEQKMLAEFFETELPNALAEVADAGGLVSAEFKSMLGSMEKMGPAAKAINEFISGQVVKGVSGLAKALQVGADATVALKGKTEELTEAQNELNIAQRRFGEGSEEYDEALDKVRALSSEVQRNQGIIAAAGVSNAASAQAFGAAIAASFAELQTRGMSVTEALAAISPATLALQEQLTAMGFSGGAAFETVSRLAAIAADDIAGPALTAVEGFGEALVGLHNSGLLTQEMFVGLTNQITQAFQALTSQGHAADDVMKLMQPQLQTIWELMEDFGFEVDAATLQLIEQAREAGLVGEAHRDASEKAQKAMERVAMAMERVAAILERVFGDAGDGAEEFGNRAGVVVDAVSDYFEDLSDDIGDVIDDVRDLRDELEDLDDVVGKAVDIDVPTLPDGGSGTPDVPGFAGGTKGKFVDFGKGTLAMLHGKEAIVPESAVKSGGSGGGPIVVPVYLNGREIARAVAEDLPDALATMGVKF